MTHRFDLSGRVALVAGASRGIGEAIAHGLAQNGATVICSSRKQADCEKVAEAIRDAGGNAISAELHLGELSDHDKIISMIENCLLYTSPSPRDQRGSRMPSSA